MKLFPSLSDNLAAWAQQQPVFFTGSAPTHGAHINVSPKGLCDSHFAVLGPNECAYIDRTGSGCETISHAYENGRLCLMFMSFGTFPRIMRLFCHAKVVEWDDPDFPSLIRQISKGKREAFDGARAVIVCTIWQVQTSCGYGVPRIKNAAYGHQDDHVSVTEKREDDSSAATELAVFEERPTLDQKATSYADPAYMEKYHKQTNLDSLDGLPGLRAARRSVGQTLWLADVQARLHNIFVEKEAIATGFVLAVLMYLVVVGLRPLLNNFF